MIVPVDQNVQAFWSCVWHFSVALTFHASNRPMTLILESLSCGSRKKNTERYLICPVTYLMRGTVRLSIQDSQIPKSRISPLDHAD